MIELLSSYFGPLDKGSCVYFLIISVIFFIGLIILVLNEAYYIATNLNNLNFRKLSSGIIILFNIFIAYFVNRLLYTMCNKSLA
jgi:hypothetical protein